MEDQISLRQLKESMRETLKNSGILNCVKANIRKEFVNNILSNNSVGSQKGLSIEYFSTSLQDRIIYSLIYHSLLKKNCKNALSVLIAECGFDNRSYLLSEIDIVTSLKIGIKTKIYKVFVDHENSKLNSNIADSNTKSLLDFIIVHTFDLVHEKEDSSTQTDESGFSALELVDIQLKSIRNSYFKKLNDEKMFPSYSVDEKLMKFERESEERHKRDLEIQLAYIRETEFHKIRLEERRKCQLELQTLKSELENEYKKRLEIHNEREIELNRRAEEKDRHFQQTLFDARQHMQREIDELRNKEQLINRKYELESQGLKVVELRIKESQILLESREKELQHRELELQEKLKEKSKQQKIEARDALKLEMECLASERSALLFERQRFEEERNAVALNKLNDSQRNSEFEAMSKRMAALTQRNAELETTLSEKDNVIYSTSNQREKIILSTQKHDEEIQNLNLQLKEANMKFDLEKKSFIKECDILRQEAQLERSKSNSLQIKCHDLEKQNIELNNLIVRLKSSLKLSSNVDRFNSSIGSSNSMRLPTIDHSKRIADMVDEAIYQKTPLKTSLSQSKLLQSSVDSLLIDTARQSIQQRLNQIYPVQFPVYPLPGAFPPQYAGNFYQIPWNQQPPNAGYPVAGDLVGNIPQPTSRVVDSSPHVSQPHQSFSPVFNSSHQGNKKLNDYSITNTSVNATSISYDNVSLKWPQQAFSENGQYFSNNNSSIQQQSLNDLQSKEYRERGQLDRSAIEARNNHSISSAITTMTSDSLDKSLQNYVVAGRELDIVSSKSTIDASLAYGSAIADIQSVRGNVESYDSEAEHSSTEFTIPSILKDNSMPSVGLTNSVTESAYITSQSNSDSNSCISETDQIQENDDNCDECATFDSKISSIDQSNEASAQSGLAELIDEYPLSPMIHEVNIAQSPPKHLKSSIDDAIIEVNSDSPSSVILGGSSAIVSTVDEFVNKTVEREDKVAEIEDNAIILEARAKVLARRKQKQLRDSEDGSQLALSTESFKSENIATQSIVSPWKETELPKKLSDDDSTESFEADDNTDDSTGW